MPNPSLSTTTRRTAVPARIMAVIANSLGNMIWKSVSGETKSCSTVPRSLERTRRNRQHRVVFHDM